MAERITFGIGRGGESDELVLGGKQKKGDTAIVGAA